MSYTQMVEQTFTMAIIYYKKNTNYEENNDLHK